MKNREEFEKIRWKGGGSSKKFVYTYVDIGRVSGKALQTVRNDVVRGKLEPGDLKSVVRYIVNGKYRQELVETRTGQEELPTDPSVQS